MYINLDETEVEINYTNPLLRSVAVCRALGIPARSVTNFSSAHDTEGSITVDIHFDSKGEPIDEFNADSVW